MTFEDINIEEWVECRELSYKPIHFVKSQTPLTDKSKLWIKETLKGRYCIIKSDDSDYTFLFSDKEVPCFEDPKEAVFYELTWS